MLPGPLLDVLVARVADYQSVRAGARQSLAEPAAGANVALAEGTLHSQHRVNIEIDGPDGHTTVPFVVVDFNFAHALVHLQRVGSLR